MAYSYDNNWIVQNYLDSLRGMWFGDRHGSTMTPEELLSAQQMGGGTGYEGLARLGITDPLSNLNAPLPDPMAGSLIPEGNDLGGVMLALAPLAAMVGGAAGVGGLSNAAGTGLSALGGAADAASASGFGFGSPEALMGVDASTGLASGGATLAGSVESPWGVSSPTPGAGIDSGAYADAAGNLYDPAALPSSAVGAASGSASLLPAGMTEFFKANPWALPLAGTLLGGLTSGGTQSQTTSTTTAQPPSQVTGALSGAANLLPGAGGASAGGSLAGAPNNLGLAGQSLAETMLGNFMLPNTWNPYGGQTTQVPTNPYYGQDNPYLQGVIDRSAGDVTARIQSQFNKPGGYGGSANQEILARELGALNNQIRYQDYGLQANLGEQDVNRRLNTSLADLTRNAGLWQNDMARNMANYQAERGRQLSAALGTPGFQSGVTESQFAPYANYANLFKGWGSNQTTQYPQGSAAQGALGGALSGYALSRMFG